jgi:hypothetical protein
MASEIVGPLPSGSAIMRVNNNPSSSKKVYTIVSGLLRGRWCRGRFDVAETDDIDEPKEVMGK